MHATYASVQTPPLRRYTSEKNPIIVCVSKKIPTLPSKIISKTKDMNIICECRGNALAYKTSTIDRMLKYGFCN